MLKVESSFVEALPEEHSEPCDRRKMTQPLAHPSRRLTLALLPSVENVV